MIKHPGEKVAGTTLPAVPEDFLKRLEEQEAFEKSKGEGDKLNLFGFKKVVATATGDADQDWVLPVWVR